MSENIYNPEFVRELFNRMSHSYERMNYLTSFGFSLRWRKQFLKSIPSTNDNIEILDLLTGMGETWKVVKCQFPNGKLSALDFSPFMIKKAERKNQKKYDNEVLVLNQDVLKNALPDNHYDLVICAFGLKTFNNEQLEILASEINRILKPNGQLSFIEVSKPTQPFLVFLYGFYLQRLVPILGRLLLGNPAEYKMLWKYTNQFQNSKKAAEIFDKHGLHTIYKSYFYGCATGFLGQKK